MKLQKSSLRGMQEALEMRIYSGADLLDSDFTQVLVCDLMSDVLTVDHEDFLLITSLTSDQVARTADIVGALGIVLVNGKKPQPGLLSLATELGIPIIGTELPCFEFSVLLGGYLKLDVNPDSHA
ncbi:hypothetical protein [Spirochaeta dissipatitropha]